MGLNGSGLVHLVLTWASLGVSLFQIISSRATKAQQTESHSRALEEPQVRKGFFGDTSLLMPLSKAVTTVVASSPGLARSAPSVQGTASSCRQEDSLRSVMTFS